MPISDPPSHRTKWLLMKCLKLQPTLSCLLILTQQCHCSRERIRRESLRLDLTWKQLAKLIKAWFLGNLWLWSVYVHEHSRWICFCSWCFTQYGVGDWGHPVSVRCQFEQTEASRIKTCLDLTDMYGEWSLSPTMSLKDNIRKVLISTNSSISNGRSLNFYRKHNILMCRPGLDISFSVISLVQFITNLVHT